MNEVREKPLEGLSKEEVDIFDYMGAEDPDGFWTDRAEAKLLKWFAKTIRAYVASGCDPTALRMELRDLPAIAWLAIAEWGSDDEEQLEMWAEESDEFKRLKGAVAACDRLVSRIDEGRKRLWLYAAGVDDWGVA